MNENLSWIKGIINIEYPYGIDLGVVNSLIFVIKKKLRFYKGVLLDYWCHPEVKWFSPIGNIHIKSIHVQVILPLNRQEMLIKSLQKL